MNNADENYGEQKVKKQNRKLVYMILAGLVFGLIIGLLMAHAEQGVGNLLTGDVEGLSIQPVYALLLSAALLMGLIGYPLYTLRHVDELERAINVNATAISGLAVLAAFPVWQILALADLLPHPTAYNMFLIAIVAGFASYIWLKIRA